MGYSLEKFNKVREILETEKIKYTYNIEDHSGDAMGFGRIRSNTGSFGSNSNFEKMYSISVKKVDFEKADFFIANSTRG